MEIVILRCFEELMIRTFLAPSAQCSCSVMYCCNWQRCTLASCKAHSMFACVVHHGVVDLSRWLSYEPRTGDVKPIPRPHSGDAHRPSPCRLGVQNKSEREKFLYGTRIGEKLCSVNENENENEDLERERER